MLSAVKHIFPFLWEYSIYSITHRIVNRGVADMITYEPLWETLRKRNITTYKLLNYYNISRGMLDNLKHNRSITMTTLNELCTILDCDVTDIIKYTKE